MGNLGFSLKKDPLLQQNDCGHRIKSRSTMNSFLMDILDVKGQQSSNVLVQKQCPYPCYNNNSVNLDINDRRDVPLPPYPIVGPYPIKNEKSQNTPMNKDLSNSCMLDAYGESTGNYQNTEQIHPLPYRNDPFSRENYNAVVNRGNLLEIVNTQDYFELKRACLISKVLFLDEDFPPSTHILVDPEDKVEWLRPHDICRRLGIDKGPSLFVNSFDRFDINQGEIGNCWFLAALAHLAEHREYLQLIIPDLNEVNPFYDNYAGIFRFRFWRFGEWEEVIIDDFLPTKPTRQNKNGGDLLYVKSVEPNEFWCALAEKAYAKLYGSYASLEGGLVIEAAVDFTGGVPEIIDLEETQLAPEVLFVILKTSFDRGSFLSCGMASKNSDISRRGNLLGLESGHAYTISMVTKIRLINYNYVSLIRIRNPHGNYAEWKGSWSDNDPNWNQVPISVQRDLELKARDDREFFMTLEDFMLYFGTVQICHLALQNVGDNSEKNYNLYTFPGMWRGETAGGCGNDGYKYLAKNPQYFFIVDDPNPYDDQDRCPVIICLTQKIIKRSTEFSIGFVLYRCDYEQNYLDANFLRDNIALGAKEMKFSNVREVSRRVMLKQGRYCIIPSTFRKGQEREFLLRIFIEKNWGTAQGNAL